MMPAFGGGYTKFQPVYVGDIARAVEIISRNDEHIRTEVDGQVFEAGGPDGKVNIVRCEWQTDVTMQSSPSKRY